ncbi:MAG TPA: glycerophosphodiester phosphodiesterase family protein [Duganella sp.]|nr:glycerophosphodiester phosphodiesterase family protein [Duganella sp.]
MTPIPSTTKRLCAALLGLGLVGAAAPALANSWNPEHIMLALKFPYSHNAGGNVVTIAHRGLAGPGCPENSACAITNAINNNIEAIELDVKESSQGTPWLFHDQNAGRLVSHSGGLDIYTGAGWNPDIRTMNDQQLNDSRLMDHDFKVSNYNALLVSTALNNVKFGANHVVIVFDIKTADAVSKIADMVNTRGMQNQVVLKFSSSLFARNPADILKFTKGVAFAPTVYAGDMDQIIDSGYAGNMTSCADQGADKYQCRIEAWADQASRVQNYAWLEVGNKQAFNGGDPTRFLVNHVSGFKRAMGGFSPVPEYRANAGDGAYYIRSNGTCCARLSDYLSNSKYFGRETQDDRWQVTELLRGGFTSIISDNPFAVSNAAIKQGRRNTQLYQ